MVGFNVKSVKIIGIPYFENGLIVYVFRRDMIISSESPETWFDLGYKSFKSHINPCKTLPVSLVNLIRYGLNNDDDLTQLLIIIGDYLAGWYSAQSET